MTKPFLTAQADQETTELWEEYCKSITIPPNRSWLIREGFKQLLRKELDYAKRNRPSE